MSSAQILMLAAALLAGTALTVFNLVRSHRRAEAMKQARREAEFLEPLIRRTSAEIAVSILFNDTRAMEQAHKRLRMLEHRWKREVTDKMKHITTP